jgi:glycosyltransferase involved in cell wall biosynthesis
MRSLGAPAQGDPVRPAVTVVIPTRNRLPLLRQALASALAQTGVDIEVVVVDDGSTDGTNAYLQALRDPRLQVVDGAGGGVSRARNAGLAAARNEWVAFLDDDDLWAPDKLAAQLDAARAGCGWVSVGSVDVDERLVVRGGDKPPLAQRDTPRLLLANHVPGGGSGTIVRTDLLRRLGGFDPCLSTFADWDVWIRLSTECDMASVRRPLVAYRVHPQSMSHTDSRLFEELALLARKHAQLSAIWGVAPSEAAYLGWYADNLLRAGAVPQARTQLRMLAGRYPNRHTLAVLVLAQLAPGLLLRVKAARRLQGTPPGYRAEADAWLAPYRQGPPA